MKTIQIKLLDEDWSKLRKAMKKNGFKTYYDFLDNFFKKENL